VTVGPAEELRPADLASLRAALRGAWRLDETLCVRALLARAAVSPEFAERVDARARALVEAVREKRSAGGLDAFLGEYGLNSEEGIILMCLAEALLRIPDAETADRLIRDKLMDADWDQHLGKSPSLLVNASTWGLMLTGRVVRLDKAEGWARIGRLIAKSGEPVIRKALIQAMRILSRQFVMGRTIGEALDRAVEAEARGYRHSYDMLGEAAHTAADAARYFDAYAAAIEAIGAAADKGAELVARPSISIKLSALHPRYEFAQRERVVPELGGRLIALGEIAKAQGIGLTVDAEEADRLDLSLDLIERAAADTALAGWDGFGLALQAYQKRALPLIAWLSELGRAHGRRLPVRLVKGAYWDSEIKRGQERGLDGYPVFTRKPSTDVSYLACMHAMFDAPDAIYPQFATHNAHSVASVMEAAAPGAGFEFQRLHGMGEALYGPVTEAGEGSVACRIYAPVGSHEDLLPYLVRRLLENGANTSFVNRISDLDAPVDEIIADPVARVGELAAKPHSGIPLPVALYGAARRNSVGIELADPLAVDALYDAMEEAVAEPWHAGPLVSGQERAGRPGESVTDPAERERVVGTVALADVSDVEAALGAAHGAAHSWAATPAEERAACLDRAADLMEARGAGFMAMAVREAGKTVPDALAELREAVDFCRFYAARARADFGAPTDLPGPTGEANSIALAGRGVFACISPWNFPLAIFTGQVTAALAAGNAAIAKPAEQSPLIAAAAVRLFHEAGVPVDALHLLPGSGEVVGAALVSDPRIAGVAFTGSTETGAAINRALAARDGPLVPLIAETGGQNAMIVDSSALAEQVVADTLASAFGAAGQRCSCLRVLFVQDSIAERLSTMLSGAMDELVVGDPMRLATDIGPVIDAEAKQALEGHIAELDRTGRRIGAAPMGAATERGSFVQPVAYEIDDIAELTAEHFGPILHLVRYPAARLDAVIDAINATGYGLTLGIHSRIETTVEHIRSRARVGNLYVNRNMIGAVVGAQPFGGEGLSGTGPKAGGPRYLHRFATERTVSIDTTAAGGNASLLSLQDDG
jgi:RHH-type transcriptional regulator, proline utilization regulon repressor / proline dehydrogenase / delta 1-pyrroline-5-carboxylate dehydrogenase